MRLQFLLIVGILFGSSIQARAAGIVKAPYPNPSTSNQSSAAAQAASFSAASKNAPAPMVPTAVPTATFTPVPRIVVPTPTATFTPIPHIVVPTSTATFTPVPHMVVSTPTVTVWPSLSKSGQSILFKAASDPGSSIQLTLQGASGKTVLSTSFSRTGRSGGYVWRLKDSSGSPVASGIYSYVLRFKQQGQPVTAQGKVTVIR